MELRIVVPRDSRNTAYCSFDGRHRIELRQGEVLFLLRYSFNRPLTNFFLQVILSRSLRAPFRARRYVPNLNRMIGLKDLAAVSDGTTGFDRNRSTIREAGWSRTLLAACVLLATTHERRNLGSFCSESDLNVQFDDPTSGIAECSFIVN